MEAKKTVIFDLDGTLAIIDKRKEHATQSNGKINWNEFFNPAHIYHSMNPMSQLSS